MTSDTLRDHFAAAALTGLIANGDYSVESTPVLAWRMADAMLRECSRAGQKCSEGTASAVKCTERESLHTPRTTAEPVSWGVADLRNNLLCTSTSRDDASEMQAEFAFETEVVPLYDEQPTLTETERLAIEWATVAARDQSQVAVHKTLRALLERTK